MRKLISHRRRTSLKGVLQSQAYIQNLSCQGMEIVDNLDGQSVMFLMQSGSGPRYIYAVKGTYQSSGKSLSMSGQSTIEPATHYRPIGCALETDVIFTIYQDISSVIKARIFRWVNGVVSLASTNTGVVDSRTGFGEAIKLDEGVVVSIEQEQAWVWTYALDYSSVTLASQTNLGFGSLGYGVRKLGEDASYYYIGTGGSSAVKTFKIDKSTYAVTQVATLAAAGSQDLIYIVPVDDNRMLGYGNVNGEWSARFYDTGTLGNSITSLDDLQSNSGVDFTDNLYQEPDIFRIGGSDFYAFWNFEGADRDLYHGVLQVVGDTLVGVNFQLFQSLTCGSFISIVPISGNRAIMGYSASTTSAQIRVLQYE